MSAERAPRQSVGRHLRGPRLVAVVLLGLALLMFYAALQIRQGGGYSAVGPRVFPLAVSSGLLVLSVIFLARTTFRPDLDLAAKAAAEELSTDWPTVASLGLALVIYVFALRPLGYVLATMLFFAVGAWILGSRGSRIVLRNLGIGLLLAAVIYLSFTRFLSVRLPAGLLDVLF